MTDIQAPDGSVIRFPDSMADADIERVMAQQYPAPAANAAPGGITGALKGASRALETGIPFMDRAVAAGKTYLPTALGGNDQGYGQNLAAEQAKNAQFQQQNPGTAAVGALTGAAPLAMLPGGAATLPGRMAIGGLEGAGIGGAYGASSSPDLTSGVQTLPRMGEGAATGGMLGAAAPLAMGLASRAITPLPTSGGRQNLVDLLGAHGVPLSAGDITGRPAIKSLENEGLGGNAFNANQNRAFTGAVTSAGEMPAATGLPGDIATDKNAIGRTFTDLASRNQIVPDATLQSDITSAGGGAKKLINPTSEVQNVADRLATAAENPIPGDVYKQYHTELTNQAYALRKTNPADADAYRDMRNALDAGMDRSIEANNPNDLGAFQTARRQWANLQPIAKVSAGTKGEVAAEGNLPPVAMQQALKAGRPLDYAAQTGPMDALANAGTAMGIGQSAPSSKLGNFLVNHTLGTMLGGASGYEAGHPVEGMLAGAAAPGLIGTLIRSPPIQKWLANQLMTRAGKMPINPSALAAILSGNSNAP